MAGACDYLLRVVVPDMAAFDRFYEDLTVAVPLRKVESVFALESLRQRTALPLDGQHWTPRGGASQAPNPSQHASPCPAT